MVENFFPLVGGQLGEVSFAGVVAMRAIVVAAIGDGQVHAVGRGWTGAEGHVHFEIKIVNGAGAIRTDHFFKLKDEVEERSDSACFLLTKYFEVKGFECFPLLSFFRGSSMP